MFAETVLSRSLMKYVRKILSPSRMNTLWRWIQAVSWNRYSFLLGHVSIQTTEQYLGCKQKMRQAVSDSLGLDDA